MVATNVGCSQRVPMGRGDDAGVSDVRCGGGSGGVGGGGDKGVAGEAVRAAARLAVGSGEVGGEVARLWRDWLHTDSGGEGKGSGSGEGWRRGRQRGR